MNEKGWILPYVKQNKRLFLFVILLGLFTVISSALLMFTSGLLISKAATKPESILLIYVPIVAIRTFGISRAVSKYIEKLASHDAVLKILSKMRVRVYTSIEPIVLSPGFRVKTGDVLGVLADDIERLQDIYIKTVFPSLVAISLYVISIIVLGFYSWSFAILMAIYAGVLVFLFPFVSLLITKTKVKEMKSKRHDLYEKLTDAVMGVSDWQFSGRQLDFIEGYEKEEQELFFLDSKRTRFNRWRNSFAQVVVAIMVISMTVWTAGQTGSGHLAHTFIAAFVLILFPLTEAFLPLSDVISEIPSYNDSLERLSNLSKQKKDEPENHQRAGEIDRTDSVTLQLKDVSFQYESKKILDGISFSLLPGEKVALLGASGSGKSTIVNLVEGVIAPTEGTITLNGIETCKLQADNSKWVAVLNQQPYVFDTSILNNIRLGKPNATDEEVHWAATQVRLHEFIESLPNGYQTPLHETGMRFSGGERHRIALARILLQNAPIIILDEPTVGLDPITEKELLKTIFDVFEGKTVLWITHHLAFIHRSDRVLFLEDGKVVVDGSHDKLVKTNERYARLYSLDKIG